MDISGYIFFIVAMVTFGYIAGNAKSFNFWNIVLLAIVTTPFINSYNLTQGDVLVLIAAFLVGYFLPYAYMLERFRDAISDAINSIRYKDAYDDIRRKEEEVEAKRREYEHERDDLNQDKHRQEQKRRKEESDNFRKQQKRQYSKEQSNSGSNKQQRRGYSEKSDRAKHNYSQSQDNKQRREKYERQSSNKNQEDHSIDKSQKERYLELLGLFDFDKQYSVSEIKKAFRRQASKYHPDKHPDASSSTLKEMGERFKEIKAAYEWLGVYGVN